MGESTRFENYTYVKDLTMLGRDLGKCIIIDTEPGRYYKTPSNGICLQKWKGNSDDRTLFELIPFFETLASSGLHDLRPVIASYADCDVVEKYKENQRRA